MSTGIQNGIHLSICPDTYNMLSVLMAWLYGPIGVGANFVNSTLFDRLITPHFEVEYALTKDRRLKIRAYARKDDISQGQLKDRIGGGISWRKEFDSIEDFRRQLNDDLKLKKSEL